MASSTDLVAKDDHQRLEVEDAQGNDSEQEVEARVLNHALDPDSTDPDFTFPLFDLPPELWVRICRFAAVHDIEMRASAHSRIREQVKQPPITRACKVIRHETIGTFYECSQFLYLDDEGEDADEGESADSLLAWLKQTCAIDRRTLPELRIESPWVCHAERFFNRKLEELNLILKHERSFQVEGRIGTHGCDDVKTFQVVPLLKAKADEGEAEQTSVEQ